MQQHQTKVFLSKVLYKYRARNISYSVNRKENRVKKKKKINKEHGSSNILNFMTKNRRWDSDIWNVNNAGRKKKKQTNEGVGSIGEKGSWRNAHIMILRLRNGRKWRCCLAEIGSNPAFPWKLMFPWSQVDILFSPTWAKYQRTEVAGLETTTTKKVVISFGHQILKG